jgi:NifU-like protein involved in Fe-S cluster formation
MTSSDVLELLGIEISPARMKCALLSLETLQGALGPVEAAPAAGAPAEAQA